MEGMEENVVLQLEVVLRVKEIVRLTMIVREILFVETIIVKFLDLSSIQKMIAASNLK